jgi:hypothetical protein
MPKSKKIWLVIENTGGVPCAHYAKSKDAAISRFKTTSKVLGYLMDKSQKYHAYDGMSDGYSISVDYIEVPV